MTAESQRRGERTRTRHISLVYPACSRSASIAIEVANSLRLKNVRNLLPEFGPVAPDLADFFGKPHVATRHERRHQLGAELLSQVEAFEASELGAIVITQLSDLLGRERMRTVAAEHLVPVNTVQQTLQQIDLRTALDVLEERDNCIEQID
ncbi:MAG: hypothetical protein M9890_02535 [Thermomicrobiales bacterium]|nr:hypothetical protein [Thermomicrobiales bacterium]